MHGRICSLVVAPLLLLVWAQPVAAAPPPAVASLTATAPSPGTVVLNWPAVAGAVSYRIYRDEDLPVQLAGFSWVLGPNAVRVDDDNGAPLLTTNSFTDAGRPALVRQFYVVTAVNADGESGLGFLPPLARIYPTAPPTAAVHGFTDTHNHQFANLGFGGGMLFGEAFHTHVPADGNFSDAEVALRWCNEAHGLAGLGDLIGNFLNERIGHNTSGYPGFAGWPRYNDSLHQQVYVDWLYRAFEGGLKLLVVHAVSNELLCRIDNLGANCDDMHAADLQIQAAKDLQQYVDNMSGGTGKGWYRIATSAADARAIINSGKLAVVLGIEVDRLFGCGPAGCPVAQDQTPEAYVAEQLDQYYAKGVRHLFPVHVFDNAFGGVSLYNPLFNYGNRLVNGSYFGVKDCGAFYGYKPQSNFALDAFVSVLGLGTPAGNAYVSECNSRGLTSLGDALVTGMMNRGMMIDLDHMSKDTFDAVLARAEQRAYSGVVAGHTTFLKVLGGQMRIEGALTDANVSRIGALGGLVSPILEQGPRATAAHPDGIASLPNAPIANDCGNSSKTFAQAYLTAIRFLGGRSVAAVGLGSDFNGLAGEPGPRFGGEACPGDASPGTQTGGVSYPFAIVPPAGVTDAGTLDKSFAGNRSFDFNVDGLAHVGLLPDLIADLRSAGAFPQDLEPLFRSAEQYLSAWELAEANGKPLPTVLLDAAPATPPSGWFATAPTVSALGAVSPGAPALSGVVMAASGAQLLDEAFTAGNPVTLQIVADGVTDVTARARDTVGRLSALATLQVKLDRVVPSVSCDPADGLWHGAAASVACTALDLTSGLADPADAAFALSADVADGTESAAVATGTHQVFDVAGWSATAGPVAGNRIDRKDPSITLTLPATGVLIGSLVAADYTCADAGSGADTCVGTVPNGSPLATDSAGVKSFVVNASDKVGNTASTTRSYVVAYNVCLLYDPTKVKKAGSTVPVKLQICDATGQNLSSPAITLTATSTLRVSTSTAGPLEDAGQANPDFNFRFDPSLAGYIFNLKTTGMPGGTWQLRFKVGTESYVYGTEFQLR